MIKLLPLLFITLLIYSCTFDNEEALFGTEPCEVSNASYALDVVPIMAADCYACHNTANAPVAGANINLEGYANIKVYVDNGFLSKSINHTPPASFMPRNAAKLSDCKIKTIDQWIAEGALDN